MAGDWIKMRCDLAEDPAVIAMAAALEIEDDAVVGKLHRLWSWADRQSRDGHAVGVTASWVDRYVHRDGFAAAMQSVGWLDMTGAGLHFPNFDRHNGKTAKQRALSNVRQQQHRANVTESVTSSSRTQRDKPVTREEKRREEIPPTNVGGERAPRGTRLPADFVLPDDWIAFCKTERPDLNPYETGRRFADYWRGVAGAKGRKADWLATWRNWVRNEKAQQPSGNKLTQTFRERDAEAGMRRWEEMTGQRHPDRDRMGTQVIEAPATSLKLLESSP